MDELRLAQIDSFDKLSSKQVFQILKKIDVNYCLQDEPHQTGLTKSIVGSTYLHAAAKKLYYDVVKELLSKNVDLFKQMQKDKRTPLLTTIYLHHLKYKCVWSMTGKLKHEMVDVLLTAQVKIGNALNPKDKNGISHFHVASAVNHAEAVELFIKAGEPVDQTIDNEEYYIPGYTALHVAIRYSSVEVAKLLIDNGADIHLQDEEGRSPLHLALERLMDLADYINMGKRACCLVCKTEITSIESIIRFIFEKDGETNFTDDIGLTAFHVACALTDTSITENFLKRNVNINTCINNNAKLWPGYTPLHFAACYNIETVKLLLQAGSDIAKSADGKTPLHLCLERYSPKVVHSILSCKPEFKNILLSDGSTTLLDVLLLMNDCDQFSTFLQDSENVNLYVPHDSPLWPGNTLLHLSILMNEKTRTLKKFYETFTLEESTNSTDKSYNCSETEEVAYWKRIVICLVRGCSLSTKNADGLTPIHLAFKLRKAKVVDKMLNSCKSNEADPNNLTPFDIACVIGKTSLVERLLAEGVDVNSPVKNSFDCYVKPPEYKIKLTVSVRANSTPLHLAVIFQHVEIVKLLLEHGADVYAQDAFGFTPLHHSLKFERQSRSIARLLLDEVGTNLKEVVSRQNLTHLHVVAWANDGQAVEKLIEAGSEVDAVFDYEADKRADYRDDFSGFAQDTPLYTAVAAGYRCDSVRALLRGGADIAKKNLKNERSPLAASMAYMDGDGTRCMIKRARREYKDVVGPIDDKNGLTMLHVACACFDLVWAKKLLESGVDVNARMRDDNGYDHLEWNGKTPLHVLVDQVCKSDESPKNLLNLVKLLLKYGADVTIKDSMDNVETPLHSVYAETDERDGAGNALFTSLIDLLLKNQKSYDVNPANVDGLSHVHIACIRNNMKVVEKFLDNGVDVNHHTDYYSYGRESGFTPLHFAFDCEHVDLARMLIKRGANVKAEARNGDTPLHIAVMKKCVDLDLLEMLHRNGADFSAKNLMDMTPLMCLFELENFTLEQLDFFLKRDSKFDATHLRSSVGIIGAAMRNAIPSDCELIFQKLIKTVDISSAISSGFNAIHSFVSVNQNGRLTLDFCLHAIKKFIKMGCDLNQQNEKGRTPIHDAVYFYNLEAIEALLLLGADLNVVDKQNKSPLLASVAVRNRVAQERQSRVTDVLDMHAWKIKLIGLGPLESSVEKDLLEMNTNQCVVNNAARSRWQNELKKMASVKISDSITAKSFLHEGISIYSNAMPSERKIVDKFFKNSENVTQRFPECGCLLNMQYRKAISKLKQS